jgi:AraC family transcriptional regulator, regulatory protein of adaptative response / methylated-DNA-[protein]-cysteine methyltransferase
VKSTLKRTARGRNETGGRSREIRRQGLGMVIGYAIASTQLGRLLVAGTARGISAIFLGESDASLESALHREYPQAQLQRDSASVARWLRQVTGLLAGRRAQLRLPLDLQATVFQRQVWGELRKIPYGGTSTYSEISRRIGRPKASRAVGGACANNPVSIVIPCHRVLRGDGELGGYRWGLARKRALLKQEERTASKQKN